jgi:hypothetical protein
VNSYVAAGYLLTFGGLALYAARLSLRRRLLERNFPRHEDPR